MRKKLNINDVDIIEYKTVVSEIIDNLLTTNGGIMIAEKLDLSDEYLKVLKTITTIRIRKAMISDSALAKANKSS